MNLKPYEEFVIVSRLSPNEANRNLARWTMLYNPVLDRIEYIIGQHYLFSGRLEHNRFTLTYLKVDNPRAAIIPIIKGSIKSDKDGCLIGVRIVPSYKVVFPILFTVGFEFLFVALAIAESSWIFIASAIFTPIFSYVAIKFSIASSAVPIQSDLKRILND